VVSFEDLLICISFFKYLLVICYNV
jgi:hypothetical protein